MFKAIAVAVALAATTAVAGAQATSSYKSTPKPATQTATPKRHVKAHKETQAQLQKEAKISEATARQTALQQVPNGTVKSSELEREKGKLIYSYDITVPGKTGVDEVNVNAVDGTVIAKSHETPKTEKAEMAKETKAKTATKK